MTRAEKAWCLILSGVLALLTTLPFLLAYERPGATLQFTGSLLAVEDGNSYIAKMRRGAEGDWLFQSPYTAQEQAGMPVFLAYLLLGKLAAGPASHEQLVASLHLARILAIPLAVFATYRFVSRFLHEERWRKWTTLLAVAGGGLGWVVFLFGNTSWLGSQPLELYSPESFGFLAALTFPHLLLARALLLLALDAYLDAAEKRRRAWAAALCLVGVVVLQPLSIAAAAAAIGAHQLVRMLRAWLARKPVRLWSHVCPAIVTLAAPMLLIGMYALLVQRDAFMRSWAAQNVLTSPHPAHYLLAYGLLIPLAGLGAWRAWTTRQDEALLLVGWVALLPLLAYLPVTFQRRLPEAGWVALAALAAFGLSGLPGRGDGRWRAGLGVLALSMVSSALLLIGATQIALSGQPPVFQDREQVSAFKWLAENADPGSVVLSSYETGNALPAWAPVFVVIGHGPESVGLRALIPEVRSFFASSGSGVEAEALLRQSGVDFVFVGEAERSQGFLEANASPLLALVYREGEVAIYEVHFDQQGNSGVSAWTRCWLPSYRGTRSGEAVRY
jgi:hypothetical protein